MVSLNLCVDQLLLALAERSQIAALTHHATDPSISAAVDRAAGLPTTRGSAEEVIRLAPDLVIAGLYTRRETRAILRRLGFPVVEIATPRDFDGLRRSTRRIARLVGHPERGERLIAALDARLAATPGTLPDGAPTALYFQRRGFVNGADSLVSEIMRAAGLRNLAGWLGARRTGRVDLERVVAAAPDYLLVDSVTPRLEDRGTHLLRHPALLASVPPEARIALPQALVICGGPMTVDAIDHLVEAMQRRRGAPRGDSR